MRAQPYPSNRSQKGIGTTGILVLISLGIFVGLFAIKVGPHYFENWTVTKVAEDLAAKPEVLKQSRSKVYAHINSAYRTNNLWSLAAEDTIELTRDKKKGYIVTVNYERRAKLFHNISVVTSFNQAVGNSL